MVVAWLFSLPIFIPTYFGSFGPPDFGFQRNVGPNGCVPWTSPYSGGTRPWVQDKYIQCMQKAYPTEEIFIQKFDALNSILYKEEKNEQK